MRLRDRWHRNRYHKRFFMILKETPFEFSETTCNDSTRAGPWSTVCWVSSASTAIGSLACMASEAVSCSPLGRASVTFDSYAFMTEDCVESCLAWCRPSISGLHLSQCFVSLSKHKSHHRSWQSRHCFRGPTCSWFPQQPLQRSALGTGPCLTSKHSERCGVWQSLRTLPLIGKPRRLPVEG